MSPVQPHGYICPTCGLAYGDPDCPHGAGSGLATGAPTPRPGSVPPPPPPPSGALRGPPPPASGPQRPPSAPPAPPPSSTATPRPPAPPPPPPSAATPRPAQPGERDIFIGAEVVPRGDCKISSLGYERCGKTTYLGMLYFLLKVARLPGYRFAWSDSLHDLETIVAQLHRPIEAGGPTFPPRTDVAKTVFLHLGLRRWTDDRYVDLYFPEFSGEDVAKIWTEGRFPDNLLFLRDFNGYVVFIDPTQTGMMDVLKYQKLFDGLLALKGVDRLDEPVAIVLSKWDLQGEGLRPEQFVEERLGGLYESWRGTLSRFRVFGVSAVGKVRPVLGRDGLPLRRDGEASLLPDPVRDAGEDGATFVYRPRNLSRPIVWLLSELLDPGSGDAV